MESLLQFLITPFPVGILVPPPAPSGPTVPSEVSEIRDAAHGALAPIGGQLILVFAPWTSRTILLRTVAPLIFKQLLLVCFPLSDCLHHAEQATSTVTANRGVVNTAGKAMV